MKVNNFWGSLTGISAEKEALHDTGMYNREWQRDLHRKGSYNPVNDIPKSKEMRIGHLQLKIVLFNRLVDLFVL